MNKMPRISVIITSSLLLIYFVFTSGMVYEALGSEVTDRLVVPYSIALSGERTGLVGLYTVDDQKCAEWLVARGRRDIPIVCDGNVALLLRSYGLFPRTHSTTGFTMLDNKPRYLFLSTWNIETRKVVGSGESAGMRGVDILPELDMPVYSEAFRSGKSVIYECGGEK